MQKILWLLLMAVSVLGACKKDNPPPNGGGDDGSVRVTGVLLNAETLSLTVGYVETLIATVVPSDAANRELTWSSSNPNVAVVEDGTVTATGTGTAVITVRTVDGGKTDACTVTVGNMVVNGLIWATHNVGEPGKFVANPQDVGGYYTFDEAQTACPAGWRLPTKNEMVSLVSNENSLTSWVTLNGVEGLQIISIQGSHVVFLPPGGYRSAGSIFGLRTTGNYWSSTSSNDNLAHYLTFTRHDIQSSGLNSRESVYTIRCVK